ncbi:MAG: deoxyribodipyrimidine photo-lyase, partial [Pseudomonadales bacterium]
MINIVWLKRDLRLTDHAPLLQASQTANPLMLLYIFEPILVDDPHYDIRHWRFIWQSLQDLQRQLKPYNASLHIAYGDTVSIFQSLHTQHNIQSIYSHQEIGLAVTYQRDLAVMQWAQTHIVNWYEFQQGAVIRGANNRRDWDKRWKAFMRAPLAQTPLNLVNWCNLTLESSFDLPAALIESWQPVDTIFQLGGPEQA